MIIQLTDFKGEIPRLLPRLLPGTAAQDRLYITGDGAPKMRVADTLYDLAVARSTAQLTGTVSGMAGGIDA